MHVTHAPSAGRAANALLHEAQVVNCVDLLNQPFPLQNQHTLNG